MNLPLKFVAIALSDLNADFGGIGFEFYSIVVRPDFEELREREVGSWWWFGLGRTQEEVGVPAESQRHDSQVGLQGQLPSPWLKSDSYLLTGHFHSESPAVFDGTLQASESSTVLYSRL